jgi:NADPH:quinone reductase-like Zn-dependent oxidoreductase
MKAIVQESYGDSSVLHYADAERPAIGPGDVLVKVAATSLNIGDWHLMTGLPLVARAALGLRAPRGRIRGMDVAGTVVELGSAVTAFAVGDEVFGVCDGGLAEFARASATSIVHKPDGLTVEQASAIPTSAATALHALRESGQVQAGQKVLVVGASGGVGIYAVQLAKAFGALVSGVCGPAKAELVLSLGASHVIDYTRVDFTIAGERYDLIIDMASTHPVAQLRRALTPTGTLVIVGGEQGGRVFGGVGRMLGAPVLSALGSQKVRGLVSLTRASDLQTLSELAVAGKIAPVIDSTYPLERGADAMGRLESKAAVGKVVVTP